MAIKNPILWLVFILFVLAPISFMIITFCGDTKKCNYKEVYSKSIRMNQTKEERVNSHGLMSKMNVFRLFDLYSARTRQADLAGRNYAANLSSKKKNE